jgi:hypothetical protein
VLTWLLVAALASQMVLIPSTSLNSWLRQAQREGETESPAPAQSSKEVTPGALVSAVTIRARRVQSKWLARMGDVAQSSQSHESARIFAPRPAELSGRNGCGCVLRC